MQSDNLILVEEFCTYHRVGVSFIYDLHEFGLIEITSIEESTYIPQSQLKKLEQIIRLHDDLNINLEGIDAITHLLSRVKKMQNEINVLKNRLRLYESNM